MSIYAVNGKEPVAAWIPSLDDAGNGTTTLTDLVGGNDGTLTNMDAATDWVADTGAGGVRALDFERSNDKVLSGNSASVQDWAISVWLYPRTLALYRHIFSRGSSATAGANLLIYATSATSWVVRNNFNRANDSFSTFNPNPSLNTWSHLVCGWSNGFFAYWNQVQILSDSKTVPPGVTTSEQFEISSQQQGLFGAEAWDGRMDDIRFFGSGLNQADVDYLYSGGNGRGVTAAAAANPAAILQINSQTARVGL